MIRSLIEELSSEFMKRIIKKNSIYSSWSKEELFTGSYCSYLAYMLRRSCELLKIPSALSYIADVDLGEIVRPSTVNHVGLNIFNKFYDIENPTGLDITNLENRRKLLERYGGTKIVSSLDYSVLDKDLFEECESDMVKYSYLADSVVEKFINRRKMKDVMFNI